MRHPVVARLSGLLIGWATFLTVAIGILIANERLADTDSFWLIGAVTVAAALAAASAYLTTCGALSHRGAFANWSTLVLAGLVNLAAIGAALMSS